MGASIAVTMGAAGEPDSISAYDAARAMGAAMRLLRRRAGLSQHALGSRIAMHHNYLGAHERGGVHSPGLDTVARVAGGLGVSIGVLAERYADPTGEAPAASASVIPSGSGQLGDGEGARVLGAAIRLLRRGRQLTQSDLADTAAVHRSHLASVEAGEKPNPGIGTVASIARGLQQGDEPRLLPLLAQTFTGELSLAHLHEAIDAARPSGPRGAPPVPQTGAIPLVRER